jgi:hypothetical protein
MKPITLLLLICAATYALAAEPFSRHFTSVTICYYDKKTDNYLDNCGDSQDAENSFYFNYQGSSNILWVTSKDNRIVLRNRGVLLKDHTNNLGNSISFYQFVDDSGSDITLVWHGEWVRIVYSGVLMIHFSYIPMVTPQEEPEEPEGIEL